MDGDNSRKRLRLTKDTKTDRLHDVLRSVGNLPKDHVAHIKPDDYEERSMDSMNSQPSSDDSKRVKVRYSPTKGIERVYKRKLDYGEIKESSHASPPSATEHSSDLYYKILAEQAQAALKMTLDENRQLHATIGILQSENEELQEVAAQAEYLADVLKQQMDREDARREVATQTDSN